MSTTANHDTRQIVVIGGGAAGSACACLLARGGAQVTLIESRVFPRSKVCGEFISPAATDVLEQLILPDRLRELGAQRIGRISLECGSTRAEWNSPREAWSLGRATLDAELLQAAVRAGAEIIQPATVRKVEATDDTCTIHLADGSALNAQVVIHADGSGRHEGRATPVVRGLIGQKCHFRAPTGMDRTVTMRSCHGAYVGTIGIEGGLSTCALTACASLVAPFGNDLDSFLASLWPAFKPAWRDGPWHSCPIPRSNYIRPSHVRSFRIGNAAAAVDPVGGEGIGLALWSGAVLAGHLLDAISSSGVLSPNSLAMVHSAFAGAYKNRLRTRLPVCRATGAALMRPRLVQAAMPVMRALPGLTLFPWYILSGKPIAGTTIRPCQS